ncbi:MAG: long-chain fatty acid--CoA ligase [Gemmatimonadetes bacterium]|nr:long-chain fatty acid--CoA ligase [Gemmatimonadota bacterium]
MGTRDYLANRTPVPVGTVTQLFFDSVDRFAERTAFRTIAGDDLEGITFEDITFGDVLVRVRDIGGGLAFLGLERGDRCAVLSENRFEWSQMDYGALCAGVPLVPIHTTLTPAQIGYILGDSGAKAVFVSTEEQLEKALEAIQSMAATPLVVVFDRLESLPDGVMAWHEFLEKGRLRAREIWDEEFRSVSLSGKPGDTATILYTSGTTGDPKGVVLAHNNLFSNATALTKVIPVDENDVTLSFLPLSHILQRMVDLCFFANGATIVYGRGVKTIPEDLKLSRPTKVVGAPRVFEKFFQAVMDQPGIKGLVVRWAREVGEAWAEETLAGRRPTWVLRVVYRLAHALLFRKMHDAMGGRLEFFVSGGAPLAPHINKFFFSAGILILEAYGLTETSPGITQTPPDNLQIGTVGPPIPGTEIRIAEDGEILVRGPQVMKEYFNRPEDTAAAFDEDEWFCTGDIGEINEKGHLCITDRKKNLLVTAGGKNIAPGPIENLVKENRFVDQVVMIGDQRHFPALLVVPDFPCLEGWARSAGLSVENRRDLLKRKEVQNHLGAEIFGLFGNLARYERPKKIGLIEEEFTIEGGILTPNQKVKRRVVRERYGSLIERFYDPASLNVDVFVEDE